MVDDSSDIGEEFLEHYGVKGMHWGITRDPQTGVRPIAKSLDESRFGSAAKKNTQRYMDKQDAKADKKFTKKAITARGYAQDYNVMADKMNSTEIDRINNDPRFKGHDMRAPSSVRDDYYNEYSRTATRILNQASADRLGSQDRTGNLRVEWRYDIARDEMPTIWVVDKRITRPVLQHAGVVPGMECKLQITWTKDGHIAKITVPAKSLAQSTEDGEDFVEHYGVKGMHWGIRKSRENVSDLSDDELRKRVDRLRLEQSYTSIKNGPAKASGLDFVRKHLGTIAAITGSVVTLAGATGKGRAYVHALQALEKARLEKLAGK